MRILSFAAIAIVAAFTMTNCSSGGGAAGGSSDAVTISGVLGTGNGFTKADASAMAVTLSDLEIYAIAFTTPPTIASASVAADGSFTVSLPGAKGSSITAIFRDKNDQSQVGMVVFEDTSTPDLNGDATQSSSVVLKDSVSLGNITLGDDGKVVIPLTQISTVVDSAPTASAGTTFDFTGTWYMKPFDGTLPTGYMTVPPQNACGGQGGPCENFPVTLVRFAGKAFTPNQGACDKTANPIVCGVGDGTVGTEDRYALSIWGGGSGATDPIGACGYKLGFTADEARAGGQIHVTTLPEVATHQIGWGPYGFTTRDGFGGDPIPYDLPWMKTSATANHPYDDCRPMKINGPNSTVFNGWACKAKIMTGQWPGTPLDGSMGWNVGIEGGGCVITETGKPINVKNWNVMGSCQTVDSSATYGTGFTTNTCTYTNSDHDNDPNTPALNLTCKNTGGQFTDSSGPTTTPLNLPNGRYLGRPETLLAKDAFCKDATTTDVAYRCYAEAFWSAGDDATGCVREYRFNWAATDPVDFVQTDRRGKPKDAFLTNILKYTADGQTGIIEDQEDENITVSTGPNSSTFCQIARRRVITLKKVSDTRLLLDLRESGQMASTDAACLGAAKGALQSEKPEDENLKRSLSPMNIIVYLDSAI